MQAQAPIPVSPTGDYRVTLDSSAGHSFVSFAAPETSTGPIPVDGQVVFSIASNGQAKIIEFSSVAARVGDFDFPRLHFSEVTLFAVQRLFGTFVDATTVQIPQSDGAWAVRGLVNGNIHSDIIVSNQGFSGTIDVAARKFHLHLAVTNPLDATENLEADLVGTIDNVPPVANAGPAKRTAECGVPFTLDGRASSDPDPGDSISHYQWFTGTQGLGNQPQIMVTPVVGTATYALHVYDQKLGSSEADVTVTTVDTKPPKFTFVPPSITMAWCSLKGIGMATAVDGCGGTVTVTNNAPSTFPIGQTVVTWTARDAAGNKATATQTVTVNTTEDVSCCPAGTHVIVGTSNNDVLTGTAGADCILGMGGQDTISGLGGDDFIFGGEGDDVIDGGSGADHIWGGGGQDQIHGGTGADTIDGGPGDDRCWGGDDNDVIHGGDGQDQLFGENGNDQLFGDTGDDRLDGGPGNDLLNGGGIHDVCIGGTGVNTFQLCETRQ